MTAKIIQEKTKTLSSTNTNLLQKLSELSTQTAAAATSSPLQVSTPLLTVKTVTAAGITLSAEQVNSYQTTAAKASGQLILSTKPTIILDDQDNAQPSTLASTKL